MTLSFEQGPIRPPSEARSLLIRVTRNCPWNRCEFCPVYKQEGFRLRSVEEVKKDIDTAGRMASQIKTMAWKAGSGGCVDGRLVEAILRQGQHSDSFRSVALWLYHGAEGAFLQDGNSLIMKTRDLAEIIRHLKKTFPELKRITAYARSHTLARKPVEALRELREAGLNRIHVGLESGSDRVLTLVKKGCTATDHIEGGRRVVAAGMDLSEYVMPGLGGRALSDDHALETARVLNAIDPHFIRIRSLALPQGTGLRRMWENGEFERLSDEEIVKEERLFLENLQGIRSYVASDHMLNLLEEVEGRLPEDKAKLLSVIDGYLALPAEERLLFRLGRRTGVFRALRDLEDPVQRGKAEELRERVRSQFGDDVEQAVRTLAERFI